MSKFAYRTIGNVHPQGKPRVYFACHPEDLSSFLEEYALKILRIQDCAIWYETEYDADYDLEELEAGISEMQLIVMPITTKLLTKPNRAMDVEFVFAQKSHIPVLPIMLEEELTDIFTKRFGNIQYINPNDPDPTRLSFDKVLETFIKAVLIGEDLAKRVRAAFDAYIFLSYRKKDRAKAQSLMRLIHKNPICQDIAIWYDEFLSPGEDFNSLISAMLEKSDLFALAVTPNLINEINYVMTTEYPAARMSRKPVLPVEMEATDKEELEKKYEEIPACIDSNDEEALLEALQKILRIVAVSENNSDPEHMFLIGLAYLDGIDVEVDYDRAVKLILAAADSGVPEAMEQLVTMYETGKGVSRDYQEGVKWRKKYIEVLRKKYEENPGEETAAGYINRLEALGDALYELRHPEEAKSAFFQMLAISEKYETFDVKYKRFVAISYSKLGNMAIAQGKLKEAREYYEKSLDIRAALAEETGTQETRRDLSISINKLGDMALAQGSYKQAEEYYKKCLDIRLSLVEEQRTLEALRDLSISYNNLGDVAREQSRLEEAKGYYEEGLAIRTELCKETETAKSRRDLSISYNKLGDIAIKQGRLTKAEEFYGKSLKIRIELADETGTVKARRDVSISYDKLGDIVKKQGNLEKAQDYYVKCMEIRAVLADETDTEKTFRDLSISYNKLGDIAKEQDSLEEAQDYYEKCLKIRLELAEETGTVKARRDLSISYNKLGDTALQQGRLEAAEGYYLKCLEIRLELVEETKSVKALRDLSVIYGKLEALAETRGRREEAQRYHEKKQEAIQALEVE